VPQPTYDVFLDEAGPAAPADAVSGGPASPDTGELITVTTTLELYEFGLRVVVPGPPGASIRDGAPLLAALKAALPSSRPPASPPPSPAASAPAGAGASASAGPSAGSTAVPSGVPTAVPRPSAGPSPAG
jgi:hypothetical protein